MFWQSLGVTFSAVIQIFLLAAIGYLLVKKSLLGNEGLDALSRLVMEVTFPLLIFCQLSKDFSFSRYADWWIFPLISLGITVIGLLVGFLCARLLKGEQHRLQFLSLVTFQNSGYLPLVLLAAILSPEKSSVIFIYLFMFLLGFNLIMFSLGVYILNFHKEKKFDWKSLFNPPVAAIVFTLIFVFFGWNKFVPDTVFKPLRMVADCTFPLAMFVVGGNLAQVKLERVNKKAIFLLALTKLVILPALGLFLVLEFRFPELIGLLILIQFAMPSATTLSVLLRQYKREDLLVSQGIFFTHLFSLITLPLFLSLYFALVMIK